MPPHAASTASAPSATRSALMAATNSSTIAFQYAARDQGVRIMICNNLDVVLSQRHEHQNAASMEIVVGHMIGESAMG
jgi:hypothetical protein